MLPSKAKSEEARIFFELSESFDREFSSFFDSAKENSDEKKEKLAQELLHKMWKGSNFLEDLREFATGSNLIQEDDYFWRT